MSTSQVRAGEALEMGSAHSISRANSISSFDGALWRTFCPREVNGLGELPVLKRVVKRYPLGPRLGKDRGKPLCERLVRKLI
jgi:hypothetical protein